MRFVLCLVLLLLSTFALAKYPSNLYQIDIILFTQRQASFTTGHPNTLLPPDTSHARILQPLSTNKNLPFHLLPNTMSHLKDQYWALSHNSQYQVLFHYSWLQPYKNQSPVALSLFNIRGWDIEGTIELRQQNYYLLDTKLLLSPADKTHAGFLLSLNQRLKADSVYYLDHPQAGMLITVHPLS